MAALTVRLPDGSTKEFAPGTTALEFARSIGPRLAKAAVAATFDGQPTWLLGAPEVLLENVADADGIRGQVAELAASGRRVVLVIVEGTDVVFAVDSIPAIFAITQDPFLVFTSNVFAILGLRSLYFALAAMMDKFRFIKVSLAIVLAFIGVKMIMLYWHIHLPTAVSLGVIVTVLGGGILASLLIPPRKPHDERPTPVA